MIDREKEEEGWDKMLEFKGKPVHLRASIWLLEDGG